jgi:hypothetical protein
MPQRNSEQIGSRGPSADARRVSRLARTRGSCGLRRDACNAARAVPGDDVRRAVSGTLSAGCERVGVEAQVVAPVRVPVREVVAARPHVRVWMCRAPASCSSASWKGSCAPPSSHSCAWPYSFGLRLAAAITSLRAKLRALSKAPGSANSETLHVGEMAAEWDMPRASGDVRSSRIRSHAYLSASPALNRTARRSGICITSNARMTVPISAIGILSSGKANSTCSLNTFAASATRP